MTSGTTASGYPVNLPAGDLGGGGAHSSPDRSAGTFDPGRQGLLGATVTVVG